MGQAQDERAVVARPPSHAAVRAAEEGRAALPDGWVSQPRAAAMFGVSVCTFRRWERRGWVRSTWAGNYKVYDARELARLVEENGRYAPPYPDPERPGVVRVPLSGLGMQRREALIDADSLPLLEGKVCCWAENKPWNGKARPAGREPGGMVTLCEADGSAPLRRVILGVTDPALHVMHRNGDPLDCRRANLVVRTMTEQLGSLPKNATKNGVPCSSRYKGVSRCKQTGKWRAAIVVNGKMNHLGRHASEAAAAEAYDRAAREVYGEHAYQNFPGGVDTSDASSDATDARDVGADAAEAPALPPAAAKAA